MREDWQRDSKSWPGLNIDAHTAFGFDMAIYSVTEAYLFASRWASRVALGPKVHVEIGIYGLQDRQLRALDPQRVDFNEDRRAAVASFESVAEHERTS